MSVIAGFFKGIGKGLDVFRKSVHFVLMVLTFFLIAASLMGGPKIALDSGSALLLNPQGPLVDQLSGDPVQRALDGLTGRSEAQTLVRDVLRVLKAAKNDSNISAVVMDMSSMAGAGMTNLQLVGNAIDDFKTSGKRVFAYGDFYSQGQYLIASHADEVYLHPSGAVFLDGFGRFRTYYKDAIEKLSIDWNVFKVGEYKSFIEPYFRNDMSPEDRSSSLVWMNQLWSSFQADVEAARGIEPGSVANYANNIADLVVASNGDLAKPAIDAGIVDELIQRDEFRERVLKHVKVDTESGGYASIDMGSYAALLDRNVSIPGGEQKVGVIVASGNIMDGDQPPGSIGGDSLARLIRKARKDESLKALVLYVNSGGGSKFASEIVQRETRLWKDTGRPFVAVMSAVAASGGYWIAMEADEIWASENTITGSIGIGGFIPTFQRTLARAGINVDGVGTTSMSGSFRVDRELSEDVKTIMQKSMENGYLQFISNVARARNMTIEEIDKIARGRVWSGKDALDIGLVDRLGTLEDGVLSAAQLAGIGENYVPHYVEREMTFEERLTLMFSTRMTAWKGNVSARSNRVGLSEVMQSWVFRDLSDDINAIARFNDPSHLYLHCFCALD
ncbi:MAG: signal peptide peptidase SppA [Gammaproteobacteria bacterium]